MYIVCAGRLSDNIANIVSEMVDETIVGVEDIRDINYTLRNRGPQHFEKVKGIVVLDGGIAITEAKELMDITGMGKPVAFITRFGESMRLGLVESIMDVYKVENQISIYLIAKIIGEFKKQELESSEGIKEEV